MQINQQCVVGFHYALLDEKGQVIESSREQDAVSFTTGEKQIIPALEQAMLGKSAGDKFQLKLKAAQAYGEWVDEKAYDIAKTDLAGLQEIELGMACEVTNPQGEKELVTIVAIEEDRITVDSNHPYAGVDLKFSIEIMSVNQI